MMMCFCKISNHYEMGDGRREGMEIKRSDVVIGHWSVMVLIWPAGHCDLIGQDGLDTVL